MSISKQLLSANSISNMCVLCWYVTVHIHTPTMFCPSKQPRILEDPSTLKMSENSNIKARPHPTDINHLVLLLLVHRGGGRGGITCGDCPLEVLDLRFERGELGLFGAHLVDASDTPSSWLRADRRRAMLGGQKPRQACVGNRSPIHGTFSTKQTQGHIADIAENKASRNSSGQRYLGEETETRLKKNRSTRVNSTALARVCTQ